MSRCRLATLPLVAVIAAGLIFASGCGDDDDDGAEGTTSEESTGEEEGSEIEGPETFEVEGRDHVEGQVEYDQTPPVGGNHNKVWVNCGFYDHPVPDELAVHAMEHGAVWVTYDPDLPPEQAEVLRTIAESQDYVLISPYPDLPAPVVASAWGLQVKLEGAEDPRLQRFLDEYRQGPQTPERGAPCTGGVDG